MIPVTLHGRRCTVASVFVGALAMAACEPAAPEPALPLDPDTYVAVMAELTDVRRFPPSGPDEATRNARADSARRQILDRHGVTADELLAFAELVGPDPDRMLELTERIVAVSDSLAREQGDRFGREDAELSGAVFSGDSVARDAAAGEAAGADSGRGRQSARQRIDPERLERHRGRLPEDAPAP